MAKQGDKRAFISLDLVGDIGVDDLILATSRTLLDDVNLTVSSFKSISDANLQWSEERLAAATAGMGLGGMGPKSKRVMLVVMNKSVVEKFEENFSASCFLIEQYGSASEAEEELADETSTGLPVAAILVPPTATESQKTALTALAKKFNIGFTFSVPRNALDAVLAL